MGSIETPFEKLIMDIVSTYWDWLDGKDTSGHEYYYVAGWRLINVNSNVWALRASSGTYFELAGLRLKDLQDGNRPSVLHLGSDAGTARILAVARPLDFWAAHYDMETRIAPKSHWFRAIIRVLSGWTPKGEPDASSQTET